MRGAAAILCAVVIAAAAVARAEEAPPAPPGGGEAPEKPLCLVNVTQKGGVPLAPMALVAFEDGVYRLRTDEGREIRIPEDEISSVAFMPFEKARRDATEPRREGDRPPPREAVRVDDRREREPDNAGGLLPHRLREERERVLKLRASGDLDREIDGLEKRLRKANSALEAAALLRRLVMEKSVADGEPPSEAEMKKLVETIERSDVRERTRNIPLKYFLRQGPPPVPGPRGMRR